MLRGLTLGAAGLLGASVLGCDAQADSSYGGEPLITIDGRVEAPLSVGDVEVGLLWLRPASALYTVENTCQIELSNETPSACVAACGIPSCDDLGALRAWDDCSLGCEGPTGVSFISYEEYVDLVFDGALGQTTSVEGEFPAQFQLDVLAPPPDDMLRASSTGERLGIGLFVALDPAGAPFELDLAQLPSFPPWLLGGSGSHLLVFAPDGVPPGSEWSTLIGFELAPGFQLIEVRHEDETDAFGEIETTTSYATVPASEATRVDLTVAAPSSIDWPITSFPE